MYDALSVAPVSSGAGVYPLDPSVIDGHDTASTATTSSTPPPNVVQSITIYANTGTWSGGTASAFANVDPATLDQVIPIDPGPGDIIPANWSQISEGVKNALCGFSHAVKGLDGVLFYGSDGDGVDEAINILTAVSLFVGGAGSVVGLAAKISAGALNSAIVMEAVATLFGETVALKLSYAVTPALERLAFAIGLSAGGTAAASDLINALVNGDPPPGCSSTTA